MTLKEKFSLILMEFWTSDWEGKCVQICDEFAVGFAEWKVGLLTKQVDGKFYFDYNAKWLTTTELLEIYKKEKGL